MLWFVHYVLMTSGLSGVSVLLGVYLKTYTDASQTEIGFLLMTFPFVSIFTKPIFCSIADRHQSHRMSMLIALAIEMLGYALFAVIPFFPSFYLNKPRVAWYLLVVGCHLGNGGLNVAWSLGDCLAINHSLRTGTPFGHMRLMGTLGWGVYGFIIGQINETPLFPKYIPAFIILHSSLLIEIALIAFWNDEEFKMIDPLTVSTNKLATTSCGANSDQVVESKFANSIPSSLSGTLRLSNKSALVFRGETNAASDELEKRLKNLENQLSEKEKRKARARSESVTSGTSQGSSVNVVVVVCKNDDDAQGQQRQIATRAPNALEAGRRQAPGKAGANPQLQLLKFMLLEDKRIVKYMLLFVIFGLLIAPMNFIFLSMERVCHEGACNFSQLAGSLLISQALIETVGFLIVPWCLRYTTRSLALGTSLFVMSLRYFFYASCFYTSNISPYWSIASEMCYGIAYAFFISIQLDFALEVANQSRLFIPDLRRIGFLSEPGSVSRDKIEAEETTIKMALRATMGSLFSGAQDGLGQGLGALLCGTLIEMYSYIRVWYLIGFIAIGSLVLQQIVELSRSRWSDTYEPKKGTKAYEIVQFNSAARAEKK